MMTGPIVVSLIAVGGLSLACFATAVWKQNLACQLDERGVDAKALVVSCSARHHYVTYEYEVPAAQGGTRTLRDSDSGPCGLVGQQVAIRYLPEDPGLSQRDRPNDRFARRYSPYRPFGRTI